MLSFPAPSLFLETGSHCVARPALKLTEICLLLPESWRGFGVLKACTAMSAPTSVIGKSNFADVTEDLETETLITWIMEVGLISESSNQEIRETHTLNLPTNNEDGGL